MSDTATPQPQPQSQPQAPNAETPKKAGAPSFVLIGVVVGALVAGVAVGGFVIAPNLVAKRTPSTAHSAENEAQAAAEPGEKDAHGEKKRAAVFRLENLIVNPAQSQGTRFLMTTVAFECADEKIETRLRDREVQVRDVVMTELESQTLEMLTAPGSRDRLKQMLKKAVMPIAGTTRIKVYLPQFVVQ